MKTIQSYTINDIQKLVDLNGKTANFDLSFKVESKDKKPFKAIVIDQVSLENNDIPEYKTVTDGIITGNVSSDRGEYLNYFLLLKSDGPVEVEVEIDINPSFTDVPVQPNTLATTDNIPDTPVKTSFLDRKFFGFSVKTLLLVFALLGVGVGVYFKFFRKSSVSDGGVKELSIENVTGDDSPKDMISIKDTDSVITTVSTSKLEVANDKTNLDNGTVLETGSVSGKTEGKYSPAFSTPERFSSSLLSRIENLPDI